MHKWVLGLTQASPAHSCPQMQLPHAGASILRIVATQVWPGAASLHLPVVDPWSVSGLAGAGLWHSRCHPRAHRFGPGANKRTARRDLRQSPRPATRFSWPQRDSSCKGKPSRGSNRRTDRLPIGDRGPGPPRLALGPIPGAGPKPLPRTDTTASRSHRLRLHENRHREPLAPYVALQESLLTSPTPPNSPEICRSRCVRAARLPRTYFYWRRHMPFHIRSLHSTELATS